MRLTVFGFIAMTDLTSGNMPTASLKPAGGSGWRKNANVSPTSRSSADVVRSLSPTVMAKNNRRSLFGQ